MNLLRSLAGHNWGTNKQTLLHLYTALIKSRISYGSELFFTASKTTLRKLDRIQCTALKFICRALKGTSLAALQNETGQLPLTIDRQKILFRHIARISRTPNNPAYQIIQDNWKNHSHTRRCPPIYQKYADIIEEIKSNSAIIQPNNLPYWRISPLHIDTLLTHIISKKRC